MRYAWFGNDKNRLRNRDKMVMKSTGKKKKGEGEFGGSRKKIVLVGSRALVGDRSYMAFEATRASPPRSL